MMDIVIPETTLDTETAVIGFAVLYTGDSDDLVFIKMEINLTTHTAIPAGSLDFFFVCE